MSLSAVLGSYGLDLLYWYELYESFGLTLDCWTGEDDTEKEGGQGGY